LYNNSVKGIKKWQCVVAVNTRRDKDKNYIRKTKFSALLRAFI
jgi:hypothetical protein